MQLAMLFSNDRKLLDSLLWGSTVGYPSDSFSVCFHTTPIPVKILGVPFGLDPWFLGLLRANTPMQAL